MIAAAVAAELGHSEASVETDVNGAASWVATSIFIFAKTLRGDTMKEGLRTSDYPHASAFPDAAADSP